MRSRFACSLAVGIVVSSSALTALAEPKAASPTEVQTSTKPKVKAGFAGIVGAAYWGNRGSLTFGGPRLMFAFDSMSAGVSFFPSLYLGKYSDYRMIPALGFGPQLTVKRLVIFMPIYYVGNIYRPLVGLGYEF